MNRFCGIFNKVLPKSESGKALVLSAGITVLAFVQMNGFYASRVRTGQGMFDSERPEDVQAAMDKQDKLKREKLKDRISNSDKV